MEIRNLAIFITLSETLNFKETSVIHNITASSVTRIIQKLEHSTGCPLFNRVYNKLALTKEGFHFLEYAKEMVKLHNSAIDGLKSKDRRITLGEIKITGAILCSSLIPKILEDFHKAHPKIKVSVTHGIIYKHLDNILTEEFDFIVQSAGGEDDESTVRKAVGTSPFVLAHHIDMPAIKSLKELNGKPFITSSYPRYRSLIDATFDKYGITPNIEASVYGHDAMIVMALAKYGYIFSQKTLIDQYNGVDNLVISEVEEELPCPQIVFRMKPSKQMPPAKEVFWKFLDKYNPEK